ncbi:hypothetical protein BY996DRAFT_6443262 [Phakopsora pachyrhizi]|nr:hypothetical protein BY996DRAFT_6443262 [Phakopsora pachyrhizi]
MTPSGAQRLDTGSESSRLYGLGKNEKEFLQKNRNLEDVFIQYRDYFNGYQGAVLSSSDKRSWKDFAIKFNALGKKDLESLDRWMRENFIYVNYHMQPVDRLKAFEKAKEDLKWTLERASSEKRVWWNEGDIERWNSNDVDVRRVTSIGDLFQLYSNADLKLDEGKDMENLLKSIKSSLKSDDSSPVKSHLLFSPDGSSLYDLRVRNFLENFLKQTEKPPRSGARAILNEPKERIEYLSNTRNELSALLYLITNSKDGHFNLSELETLTNNRNLLKEKISSLLEREQQFDDFIKQKIRAWSETPPQILENLIYSMPNRMHEDIGAQGGHTHQ